MDTWFLSDKRRMLSEVNAVKRVAEASDWLKMTRWHATCGRLHCDAEISAHGHAYPVRLTYPDHFPDVAPWVAPINDDRRWTEHQFGKGGVLCLELRPDNWDRHRHGVEMLESTHRLLYTENPLGNPDVPVAKVPSGHVVNIGEVLVLQQREGHIIPFISLAMQARMSELPDAAGVRLGIVMSPSGLMIFQSLDGWKDPTVPASDGRPGWHHLDGCAIVLPRQGDKPKNLMLKAMPGEGRHLIYAPDTGIFMRQLMDGTADHPEGSDDILLLTPDSRAEKRLAHALQQEVRVGIVGLGSMGSKVAMSLARSGVKQFLLIDGDVLLPGNLVRHTLDWQHVGVEKVKGMATAIRDVQPGAEVDTCSIEIAGQGSARAHAQTIEALSTCSVIIEATTEGEVFNLLGAIARLERIPMLWGMVYGGGLGGFIARSRPGLDASPQQMRRAYHDFCEENPVEPDQHPSADYEAPHASGGPPLTASDADVAIIAYHLAQMALDLLAEGEETRFPHSMYLVGFRKGWVFEQPFHTFPLVLPDPEDLDTNQGAELTAEELEISMTFLASLLEVQET